MSTVSVTGRHGTSSSPAGGAALARNTGSPDSSNMAVARGGAAANATNRYADPGGYASAIVSTVADIPSKISATASARGGAGGYNPGLYATSIGSGGNVGGYAYASNTSTAITNVSALAAIEGGSGGAGASDTDGSGGGIVLSPGFPTPAAFGAFAANAGAGTATAKVTATGGAGGGTQFRAGGSGGSVGLVNAARGRTNGGTLSLTQDAIGGAGGVTNGYEETGTGGTGGTGGNAASLLTVVDDSSLGIVLNVAAVGGNGGAGFNQAGPGATGATSGNGGIATARGSVSGIGNVSSIVTATGGSAGYNTHESGLAAEASASAVAITTGLTQKATAVAKDIGGAGGSGYGQMFAFGNAGNGADADSATAFASSIGGNAAATANAIGGNGGNSAFYGTGSGGNASLINAVSASSVTGGISLTQTATGGNGGKNVTEFYGGGGGAGGAAYSSLTTTTSTTGATVAKVSAIAGNAGTDGNSQTYGGGDAVARLNITARGSIISNVTALGGNAFLPGEESFSGNATAYGIAISSGGSGSVVSNSDAVAGETSFGYYAVASATSIADASHSSGTAKAVSTAGAPAVYDYFNEATANSNASALTANGKTAIAQATGYGYPGSDATSQADATATTSDGIIEKLVAAANAPVSGAGTAQAEVDGGTKFNSSLGTDDSYAFAGGLAAYATLGPNTKAVFHSAKTQNFGNGTLGYNADPYAFTPQTYTSSITWDLNQSTLSGDTLDLGLVTANAKGDNFATLTFKVSVQGSMVIDKTFTSPVQAAAYFSDNALNLGSIAGGTNPLDVTVSLSATPTGDINDGYGFSFMLGATQPSTPAVSPNALDHVAVVTGSTGFEPRMEFLTPAASAAPAVAAPSVTDLFADIRTGKAVSSTPLAGASTPLSADNAQVLSGFGATLTDQNIVYAPLGSAAKLLAHTT